MAEDIEDVDLDESRDSRDSNDSGCVARFPLPDSFDIAQDVQELVAHNLEREPEEESRHHKQGRLRRAARVRLNTAHPYGLAEFKERRLRVAAAVCNVEEVKRLLTSGTNPNCIDQCKRSPLHLAAVGGYGDVVKELLKHGANPNSEDTVGNTPLHLAVLSGGTANFDRVVGILLEGGASVHILDKNGKNAFDLAESKLRLLRSMFKSNTPERVKMMNNLMAVVLLIMKYYVREQFQIQELDVLRDRLEGLSTNDEVASGADTLLASIEQLTISK